MQQILECFMKIFQAKSALKAVLEQEQKENKSIGFVPTMGALHSGHIELVKKCVAENDICIVSIFVNPTQFNDRNDLINYPRTYAEDYELLKNAGCHYVFSPSEEEIYPEPDTRVFDFGELASTMEGKFRPGHFNGVAQVVSKLFEIVDPNRAYFGIKDFQQLAIIKEVVKQLNLNIEIVPVSIVRESDGLAMSSRNQHLNKEQRKEAAIISKILKTSDSLRTTYTVKDLEIWVKDQINQSPELTVEYFDIIDGFTLKSIKNWGDTEYSVGCIAVFAGSVRLIDNVTYQ